MYKIRRSPIRGGRAGGTRGDAERRKDGTRSGDERRMARQILRRVVPTPDFRRDKLTGAYDASLLHSLSFSLVSLSKSEASRRCSIDTDNNQLLSFSSERRGSSSASS